MMNYKMCYEIDTEKTYILTFNRNETTRDILYKIKNKHQNKEYKFIHLQGNPIDENEIFFKFYNPLNIYIITEDGIIARNTIN